MKDLCKKIRKSILQNSYEAGACHIGSALSCVEIVASFYLHPYAAGEDSVFIFSKASGACALYSTLAEKGIIPEDKVAYYLKNYPLPTNEVPGVTASVGSLGHGLPIAVGLALADRNRYVYILMSDGELQEGTTWESLLFAAHHELSNLIIFIDRNRLQACGETERIIKLEPLEDKLRAFGCAIWDINGNDVEVVSGVMHWARFSAQSSLKPKVVIANTIKGKGVDFMENNNDWHYANLTKEQLDDALCKI